MLSKSKTTKLQLAIKSYCKKYLNGKVTDLDESGTRLMVNSFLTDVLGFIPIEEVKTEYMIRGTYADYVIQMKGIRHFLVEVKALSLSLSANHLRQAINYGANEGIEWALLTNGKNFDFYKILFTKPIESKKVFSIDLSDLATSKDAFNHIQFICKDAVNTKGLDLLWNKTEALDPNNIAGLLYSNKIVNVLKRELKNKFKHKFSDEEVEASISRVICEPMSLENIKQNKGKKVIRKKVKAVTPTVESENVSIPEEIKSEEIIPSEN